MFLVTVGLHAARTASGRRCKEQPVLIKSVTAITRRRQNYSRLELQEVRAKAAMNAVLPRFIKQYRRAPHGCASSNHDYRPVRVYDKVAPHTGALVVTVGLHVARTASGVAPHTGALVVTYANVWKKNPFLSRAPCVCV